jgi:Uncharacterised protein family (UPF0158)
VLSSLGLGFELMVERSVMSAVEEGDEEFLGELSDWQKPEIETARAVLADERNRFIQPPNKFDFHEYRHMERFIGRIADESAADQLWRAIKGRGAFRCFNDTLYRLGIQDDWFRYREKAMRDFARRPGHKRITCPSQSSSFGSSDWCLGPYS